MDLKKQYSTTGLVGIYEAVNFMGLDILMEDGQNFVKEILNTMNYINDKFSKQYNYMHNIEQVPAENSAIKLAEKDKMLGYQNKIHIYSNQFIPLILKADMLDRINMQGLFDSYMSGGAILHLNIEEKITNSNLISELIIQTVKKGVIYFAICYNLQKCEEGHISIGKNTNCQCGSLITDNYIRVVGFLVNTKSFHKVRREEDVPHRQFYKGI